MKKVFAGHKSDRVGQYAARRPLVVVDLASTKEFGLRKPLEPYFSTYVYTVIFGVFYYNSCCFLKLLGLLCPKRCIVLVYTKELVKVSRFFCLYKYLHRNAIFKYLSIEKILQDIAYP